MVKKVAVFFGGKSAEREISVLTGVLAMKLIDPEKYCAVPVYIHSDGKFYTSDEAFYLETFQARPFSLRKFSRCFFETGELVITRLKKDRVLRREKIDAALNCCHGGAGEGGGVAALCELYGIPSASPTVAACAVCMDKEWTKLFFKALKIPCLDYAALSREEYVRRGALALGEAKKLGFPLIVKPADSGSSIGISVIEDEEALKPAAEQAFLCGEKLIFEPFLRQKTDVNCAAYLLKGKVCVSEPEEAFGGGVYGFKEKYFSQKPSSAARAQAENGGGLSKAEKEKIKKYTAAIYKRLETSGVVRVDFLKGENGVFAGEINAVPGSLAYYLFCEKLTDGRRFLTDLIDEAFFGAKRETAPMETGVLQSVSAGGKRGFAGVRL